MKSICTVLDIGSQTLRLLVGTKSINNQVKILYYKEEKYDGFENGEFFEVDKLRIILASLVKELRLKTKFNIKKIFIGVPSHFCAFSYKDAIHSFAKVRRINSIDVDGLNRLASAKMENPNYSLITIKPSYYLVDDKVLLKSPVGQNCRNLSAKISLIFAEKKFIDLFTSIFYQVGIADVKFIASDMAVSDLLDVGKDKLVIDCGGIFTNMFIKSQNGIRLIKNFSLGGGHINVDLMEYLHIDFESAEQLKKQVKLFANSEQIKYSIIQNGKESNFLADAVCKIVLAKLDDIIAVIKTKCLAKESISEFEKIYLCGAGLSSIFGARAYLAKQLGAPVELLTPPPTFDDVPEKTAVYALLRNVI